MQPTTTLALLDSIKDAVRSIDPTFTQEGCGRWRIIDRDAQLGDADRAAFIALKPGNPTPGGLWGSGYRDVEGDLVIMTSYRMSQTRAESVVAEDYQQLLDALHSLRGATSGFIHVEPIGADTVEVAEADAIIVQHQYRVRYLRASEAS